MKLIAFLGLCAALGLASCGDDGASGSSGGSGGAAGASGSAGTGGPSGGDIQYLALNPLPAGEQILFNDWNAQPNTVSSMKPDGSGELGIFQAYRVWAMGVSHDTSRIAFACGDPLQEQHYGLTLGDAIQNTWLYDVATQQASVLSWGNHNDECHTFNATDDRIYVCRRHDFQPDNSNKGYRLGWLGVPSGALTWVGAEPPVTELELHPQPTADDKLLFYTLITIQSGKQNRSIRKRALPDGAPELVRDKAGSAVLSPDGQRLLFADALQQSALYTMKLDGTDVIKVASHPGTSTVWSPDGTRVAYLWGEPMDCSHVFVVAADGSQADTPTKIRDCGSSFVTELAWIAKN